MDNLKYLETQSNFVESVKDKKGRKINFFDQGGKRDWSKSLNHNLVNEIENSFKKEMIELNYL